MLKKSAIISIFCIVLVEESLLSADTDYVSLFADHKARHVGDIITIIIDESSSASKSDASQISKKSASSGSLEDFFGIGNLPLKVGVDAGSGYSDSGTIKRSGTMSARVSATIKEVLPNGNLVLEGTRNIAVNDEVQTITISGVIRPQDISSDNTVLSIYLANAEIKYKGKSAMQAQPGIVTNVMKVILSPFHWVASIFGRLL